MRPHPQHRLSARRRPKTGEAGFTLVELLVVLVILGLLAALAGPRVIGYLSSAKTDTAKLQISGFQTALDTYRLDMNGYPTSQEGLKALVAAPGNRPGWRGPYLTSTNVPLDPWGNPYVYRAPGESGRAYDLLSLGSDGRVGGDGEAADLSSADR